MTVLSRTFLTKGYLVVVLDYLSNGSLSHSSTGMPSENC